MAKDSGDAQLVVQCAKCGKNLKTGARYIGRTASCPSCGARIRIVDPAEGESQVVGEQMATREGALLKVVKQNDVGVITFTSSRILDQSNVQQLGDEFDDLLRMHRLNKIVLNFHGVGYMSSAVMGKLNGLRTKLEAAKGELRLCNIEPNIFEIFKIMRFDKLFRICKDEDQAVIELMH
jgi:anti-sigma B factor antagonist